MTQFTLPFDINYPHKEDFVISKCYEEKTECYLLTIPKGKQLSEPLRIQIKPSSSKLDFTLKVELEEGSSAVILEEWGADVVADSIHYESHILCSAGASLKYIILNLLPKETQVTEKRNSEVLGNATCHVYQYVFGGSQLTSDLLQTGKGENAELHSDIVCRSSQKQELSFRCEHLYAEKNGNGEISMRGIAQDKGILAFDGMINIAQTGLGSSGFLDQEVLNLSPDTVVKAVPGLKIDTNDVKAGHRAAIRNLNEEDFYYFAARGIDEETAKKLLITGFLGKELKKIEELEVVYEAIKKLI